MTPPTSPPAAPAAPAAPPAAEAPAREAPEAAARLEPAAWREACLAELGAAVARVCAHLEKGLGVPPEGQTPVPVEATTGAAALRRLGSNLGLSPFELDVVAMLAGWESDDRVQQLVEAAMGPAEGPTFGLALRTFPGGHWSALLPEAALRRWQVVAVQGGGSLVDSPIRLDERVLHHLLGWDYLDPRLAAHALPVRPQAHGDEEAAARIERGWRTAQGQLPAVQLVGATADERRAAAADAAARLGLPIWELAAAALPADPAQLAAVLRLLERESALAPAALYVEAAEGELPDATLAALLDSAAGPLLVGVEQPTRPRGRPATVVEVRRPAWARRLELWRSALGAALAEHAEELAARFDFPEEAARAACREARDELAAAPPSPPDAPRDVLLAACRRHAATRIGPLARRIEPAATWDDLVLPAAQRETLAQLVAHARHRGRVLGDWGFGAKRGPVGVTALFAGPSGVGKTLAAEAVAHAIGADLLVVDLSQATSKWVGETEKNLRRLFDAAEGGGSVLLIDEGDALFGRRTSDVKDAMDRFANMEVAYLLQRMESYRGVCILTTNLRSAVDPAFLRRLRFVVDFPLPAAADREEIWRRSIPAAAPTAGIDYAQLSRLAIAGGAIRNIALGGAYLAAAEGTPIGMPHLLRAARSEYAKAGQALPELEVREWT